MLGDTFLWPTVLYIVEYLSVNLSVILYLLFIKITVCAAL